MRSLVLHVPTGIQLDLGVEGYGHPDGPQIIYRDTYRQCPKGTLKCITHAAAANPWLYLQVRNGQMWAIHYDGSLSRHRVHQGMSDEHKRQTEYVVRAAEDAGFPVTSEARGQPAKLTTGVIPDAVIYGPVTAGIEIQRSQITRSAAVRRTRSALAAGTVSTWFTDKQDAPRWFWHVPSVGMNPQMRWDTMPPKRAATVTTGLRVVKAVKCHPVNLYRCPDTKGRHCGKYHARHEPWTGMTVDDVAAGLPAGEIAPMRFFGKQILLVSPDSRRLYEEMIGRPVELAFPPSRTRTSQRQAGAVECENPQPAAPSVPVTSNPYSDTRPCCKGGTLKLWCQLCGQSPTYWRIEGNETAT